MTVELAVSCTCIEQVREGSAQGAFRMSRFLVAVVALSILTVQVPAQEPGLQPSASKAYLEVISTLQKNMPRTNTGDPDVDLARRIVPLHQSVIEMAELELQFGKDPELRNLAEEMVRVLGKQLSQTGVWLKMRNKY